MKSLFKNSGNSWGEGGYQRPPGTENSGGWGGCKSKSLPWWGYGYFLEPHNTSYLLISIHTVCCELWGLTVLFTNMRILKFQSQSAAVNHLNGPLRKQNLTLTGSKGQGLWFVIGGFWSVLCVSVFQGSLLVIIIMIDGSEKHNCEGGFWTLGWHVCERRSKAGQARNNHIPFLYRPMRYRKCN